jgi:hypothetical protein
MEVSNSSNLTEEEKKKLQMAATTLARRLTFLDIAVKGGWNAGNKKY